MPVASPALPPRILVPARTLAAGRAGRKAVAAAGTDYLAAIVAAGGVEMVVAPRPLDDAEADLLLRQAHGLCLLGGPDVEPARYGAAAHPATYGTDRLQDDFEIALLQAAVRTGRPVLAICRGLQLVNVALGGTLVQHLPDRPGLEAHAPPTFPAAEPGSIGTLLAARVEPGCRLHRLLRPCAAAGGFTGSCDPATFSGGDVDGAAADGPFEVIGAHSHHQAVDVVAPALSVVARAADGVVEALEHPDHWLVATQWHPEDTFREDSAMLALFRGLIDAAREVDAG
ncbi:MAG: gamma-glutamyl-gamma-aminobutyrate hydrolase family protein [Acidimicrobiales bacterium]